MEVRSPERAIRFRNLGHESSFSFFVSNMDFD
jgi:hypothetical protein